MTRDQGSPRGRAALFKLEMRNGGAAHKIRSAAEYRWAMPEGRRDNRFPVFVS